MLLVHEKLPMEMFEDTKGVERQTIQWQ